MTDNEKLAETFRERAAGWDQRGKHFRDIGDIAGARACREEARRLREDAVKLSGVAGKGE